MTTEPPRGEGGPPSRQQPPGAPPDSPYGQPPDGQYQPGPNSPYAAPSAQPYDPRSYQQPAPSQPYQPQDYQHADGYPQDQQRHNAYQQPRYQQPQPEQYQGQQYPGQQYPGQQYPGQQYQPQQYQPEQYPGQSQQYQPQQYQSQQYQGGATSAGPGYGLPPRPEAPPRQPPRTSFDGPLPDAPVGPPMQWGQPPSGAAPAPKAGPRPALSRLAVATLALGVLLGGLGLALITGLVALFRIRSTHKRGTALAVAGMVLTVAWGVGAGVLWTMVLHKPEARDASGKVVRAGDVLVTTLRVGDCLEKWATTSTVGSVSVVPCTSSHDAEVYYTFTASGGPAFPGNDAVTKEATTQCVAREKTAVKAADAKTAKVAFFKPVEASWKQNQKQVSCVVKLDKPLTRSVHT